MGFDNECILNIQSLPDEYFCACCRNLVYPNEALQPQCTHLYCKACLAYMVAKTHACPYDGHLLTEADSKPLIESNKAFAETIGKVSVHCLYHRSGCQWQGTLTDCVTHCTGCNFGNYPVVCNRCGTQTIHRQVQEHAYVCPGSQPQAQQVESGQVQASTVPSQTATQDAASIASTATVSAAPVSASAASPAAVPATMTTSTGQGQAQVQGSAVVYRQPVAQSQTTEHWYQQQQLQYQQYYQQYPGYDPYQQQYQQYAAQYQQQAYPQYMQCQMLVVSQQPQAYMQPQPQPQSQPQAQAHPQAQPLSQTQPQIQAQTAQPQLQQQHVSQSQPQVQQHPHSQSQPTQLHAPAQIPQVQAQQPPVPAQQPYPQAQLQAHPPPHLQQFSQSHQPHPHSHAQASLPQLRVLPQHQQPVPPQQPPQAPQHQPWPQHPPQAQIPQPPLQDHPHHQPILYSQPPHPLPRAVSGYQSYPQPVLGAPQQRPLHMPQQQGMPAQYPQMQNQFLPLQPPQMRPPHAQMQVQAQQQQTWSHPAQHPGQQISQHPAMQPYAHQRFPQQKQAHLHPGQTQKQGAAPPQHQMHPHESLRPQGPAYVQQHILGQPHAQLNVALTQGMPAQQAQARLMLPNQGISQQPVQQSPGSDPTLMQPGVNQHSSNQTNMGRTNLCLATPESQPGATQQSQLQHSCGKSVLVPASPMIPGQEAIMPEKVSQIEAGTDAKNSEGSESADKIFARVSDFKSVSNKEEASAGVKEDTQVDNNDKDTSELAYVPMKGPESFATDENVDGSLIKKVNVEEANNKLSEGCESSHVLKLAREDNVQAPHRMPQPTHQSILPAQERGFSKPGYHDRKPSQIPQQQLCPDDHRGGLPPSAGPPLNQERYPQHIPYGHPPNMPEAVMVSQRPMPQGIQERRFAEPPPHLMLVHGQSSVAPEPFWPPPHAGGPGLGLRPPLAGAPAQFQRHALAPQGHSQSHVAPLHAGGTRPPLGEPLAQPMMGGLAPRALDALGGMMAGGPPFVPEDQVGRPAAVNTMDAEAYAIKRPGATDGRQLESHCCLPPKHAPCGPPNVMNMNGMPTKVPVGGMQEATAAYGLSEDGFRPRERFMPFPEEGFNSRHGDLFWPSAQDSGRLAVGQRDFEEDLKQFPRPAHSDGEGASKFDGYVSSSRPLDRGPHQFGHDVIRRPDGVTNAFSSRPLPIYQSGAPIPPSTGGSEVLEAGQRERPVALNENLGRRHDLAAAYPDIIRPVPEFGHYRMDGLPPLKSPGREYSGFSSRSGLRGPICMEDNDGRDPRGFSSSFRDSKFPVTVGPSHSMREIPDCPGSLRMENLGPSSLPGQLRRSLDGIRSERFGMQNVPCRLQDAEAIGRMSGTNDSGRFRNRLGRNELGGPGNILSHMHTGDTGFSGNYPMRGLPNEAEQLGLGSGDFHTLDNSRKRKPESTGWCRICMFDCLTVQALELHSQTREHQKMAIDLVMSIKQGNAKKHKLTSEIAVSLEDSNKSRKTCFENRGNLQ